MIALAKQTDRRALIVADAVAKWQFAQTLQDAAVAQVCASLEVSENVAMDTLNSPDLTGELIEQLGVTPMPYRLGDPSRDYPPELEQLHDLANRIDFLGRLAFAGVGVLLVALLIAWVSV